MYEMLATSRTTSTKGAPVTAVMSASPVMVAAAGTQGTFGMPATSNAPATEGALPVKAVILALSMMVAAAEMKGTYEMQATSMTIATAGTQHKRNVWDALKINIARNSRDVMNF